MPFKLSNSSLNLMKECPRCFWMDKHGVWKRPTSIFPSLPSGMDSIMKKHFNKFRDKGELPPELCGNAHCENMSLFEDENLLRIWQNNLKGIKWEDKEGNVLSGAIDNILIKEGKLIVLDYKTRGYALKENTAEHYQIQLDIYSFLLRKNKYETEDFAFLLFYVPKEILPTGEFVFDTILKKMSVNPNNAEQIFEKAISLLNSECPKKTCEWCKRV